METVTYDQKSLQLLGRMRTLKRIVDDDMPMIYIGDGVVVSDRIRNEHWIGAEEIIGRSGIVTNMIASDSYHTRRLGGINYRIENYQGSSFIAPLYSLDIVKQTDSNALLEMVLKERVGDYRIILKKRKRTSNLQTQPEF